MYSSIPAITITGSSTAADGNAFSATTDTADAVVIGAVLTSSYAITASYAMNGGGIPVPSDSASYALTSDYVNQISSSKNATLTLGNSIIPDTGKSLDLGSADNPVDTIYTNNITIQNNGVVTTDNISTNAGQYITVSDLKGNLIGTASFSSGQIQLSSSSGTLTVDANSIIPKTGMNVSVGTSANPFAEVNATTIYNTTQYVDEIVGNNNGYIAAVDPIHGTLVGTASYSTYPISESNGAIFYNSERLNFGALRQDPTGFPNRTETTLSYDNSTKKFMITGSNFKIYSAGKEYNKNSEALSLAAVTPGTLTRIYYSPETLSSTTGLWDISAATVPVATLYWDGTKFIEGDERHGIQMDGATQEYLHETMGPRYASGYTLTHTGSDPRFVVSAGHFYDDDNGYYDDYSISQSRIIWHSGSVMVSTPLQDRLWITSSAGTIAYDTGTATASVAAGRHVAYWLYVVNGTQTRFISVMGQRQDTTLANAIINNVPSALSFGTFPLDEAKLIYRIIYDQTGTIEDTTDYRQSQFGGSNYTATDHGTLSGLADDDHFQYLLLAGRTGGQSVTGGITASLQGSASYALTASYALNGGTGGGGSLSTGSTYPITSSWANNLVITSSAQTTGSYTLVGGDHGKVITFTNATTNSIVIPSGLPTNFNCFLVSVSTGSVLVTGSGVVLNNANNCLRLSGRYAAASIIGYLPDSYILTGDTSI